MTSPSLSCLDALTPKYQIILKLLPPKERKCFCGLLWLYEGTAKRISQESRLDVHSVSVYLQRLANRKLVVICDEQKPRLYRIADATFSKWHVTRRCVIK